MAMAFYHSYTLVQGKEHSCPAVDYGDDTVLLNKQGQCGPSVSKQYKGCYKASYFIQAWPYLLTVTEGGEDLHMLA